MSLWYCKKKTLKHHFMTYYCYIEFDRFLIGADWNFQKGLIDIDVMLGFISLSFIIYKKQEEKKCKKNTKKTGK